MNLAEAREQYRIVREKLLQAKEHLLGISKNMAKAEKALQKHGDAYALAVAAQEQARVALRAAAAGVPSSLADELRSLCSLGPNVLEHQTEGSWTCFDAARTALSQANHDVSELERVKAEAFEMLKGSESERAEAHAEFLKWQKNAVTASGVVERFLAVEVAGMAPQALSQVAPLEIDPEIERPALSGTEPESCQNPQ